MAIYSIDDDGLAINEEIFTFHFHAAEANFLGGYFNYLSSRIDELIFNVIQSGGFCRPRRNARHSDREFKRPRDYSFGSQPCFVIRLRNLSIPESSVEVIIAGFLFGCSFLRPLRRFLPNDSCSYISAFDSNNSNPKFVVGNIGFIYGVDMSSHIKRSNFII